MNSTSRARAAGISAAAAAICAVAACATTATTTGYTPITGILIRSSTLVEGFGCGMGPGQVYRYVAIVDYARAGAGADGGPDAGADGGAPKTALAQPSNPPWTNIFDCFTDGVFENLPSSSTGGQAFSVSIFAYDKASYGAALLPSDLGCAPGMTAAICKSTPPTIPTTQIALAPWTTTCSASQQQGIPVLAVCAPLSDSKKTSAEAGAADGAQPDGPEAGDGVPDGGVSDGSTGTDTGTTSTDAGNNR